MFSAIHLKTEELASHINILTIIFLLAAFLLKREARFYLRRQHKSKHKSSYYREKRLWRKHKNQDKNFWCSDTWLVSASCCCSRCCCCGRSFVWFFLTKNPTRIPAVYFLTQKTHSQKIRLVPLFIQFSAKIMPVDSKEGKFPWMEWSRRVFTSSINCPMESSCSDVKGNLPNTVHGARAKRCFAHKTSFFDVLVNIFVVVV